MMMIVPSESESRARPRESGWHHTILKVFRRVRLGPPGPGRADSPAKSKLAYCAGHLITILNRQSATGRLSAALGS
jgi:hypothetical protein